MFSPSPLLWSIVLQAVGALLGAAAIHRLARTQGHRFLRHWAMAWRWRVAVPSLAVVDGLSAAYWGGDRSQAYHFALTMGIYAASYVEAAYFAFGAAELHAEGSAKVARRHIALAAASVLGVSTGIALGLVRDAQILSLVGVVVPSVTLGLVLLACTLSVWRTPAREEAMGRTLVVLLLIGLALVELRPAWLYLFGPEMDTGSTIPVSLFQIVLTAALALCLTIFVLEEHSENARTATADLERLTRFDELTGLHNRRFLLETLGEALTQARRAGRRVGLYVLDLDRFKLINESLGHAVGDKVLHAIGQRLRMALRDGDTVARMPGDEFAVLAPGIRETADAVTLARKVQEAIRLPVRFDGCELFVTASVGVSVYPDDGDTVEILLKNADAALTRAKNDGPDLFQLYTAKMNAIAMEQLALEHALRRALNARELELFYQPIVDMEWNEVQIVEATLRWRHPELGLLRPSHFLPVAEATGLIVPMGSWALREACRQLRVWRADHPKLRVTVNFSLRQLRQAEVVDEIAQMLKEFGLPGDALELEIGEATVAQCDDVLVGRLEALRAMGTRIAIDDFGTGWSSLGVLRQFPVNTLKIDTSFVHDVLTSPRDGEIAGAVVALAHALGLTVVAEGVENPAQLELLRRRGCELWQGYLCCPPVTAVEVQRVLGRKLGIAKIIANEGGAGGAA